MIRRPPRSTLFPTRRSSDLDFNNPFFGEQRGGQRPPFTFNLDAVQDFVVVSDGANAEFGRSGRSEEHTSELQSQSNLVCRLLLEKKKKKTKIKSPPINKIKA